MDDSILKRMKEVEQAVLDLDESVRGAAFSMMEDYILGGAARTPKAGSKTEQPPGPDTGAADDGADDDVTSFFAEREIDKPAEAVYAIAGYFFSQYGSAAFTVEDVRALADRVGLTVPDRPDNTLRNGARNKKSLFRAKDGGWMPTTMGELVLKEKFTIKKGSKKRPVAADGDDT